LRTRCLVEARRLTGSAAEAEDVVQDALVVAWRKADSCRSEDPLPWLLAITRRKALRRLSTQREHLVGEPVADAPIPGEEVEALAARLDLGAVLATLPQEDREMLVLRYEEDLTQPAVAKRLGLPEGTTKVRLHRIRARLKQALEAQDG